MLGYQHIYEEVAFKDIHQKSSVIIATLHKIPILFCYIGNKLISFSNILTKVSWDYVFNFNIFNSVKGILIIGCDSWAPPDSRHESIIKREGRKAQYLSDRARRMSCDVNSDVISIPLQSR